MKVAQAGSAEGSSALGLDQPSLFTVGPCQV